MDRDVAGAWKCETEWMSYKIQKEAVAKTVAAVAAERGFSLPKISVRDQRSRWGSCSGQGNLNFNCLLMLTPDHVLDYVVVHELCHRKEMNHSPAF